MIANLKRPKGDVAFPEPDDIFKTSLFGIPVIQNWCDLWLWEKMFENSPQVKAVIELGTLYGGLSQYLLCQTIARGMHFRTFDWQRYLTVGPLAQRLGLAECFIHDDLWAGGLAKFQVLVDQDDWHPLLLLADDGNKPKELATFVPLLRPGDIIAVHDWGTEVSDGDLDPIRSMVRLYLPDLCDKIDGMTLWMERI